MNSIWAYALAVVFGVIIFIVPAIVAYLVALFVTFHKRVDCGLLRIWIFWIGTLHYEA